MIVKYDEQVEGLLKKICDDPNIILGIDAAEGKDKCIEVTYAIRYKDEIIKTDVISFKEAK